MPVDFRKNMKKGNWPTFGRGVGGSWRRRHFLRCLREVSKNLSKKCDIYSIYIYSPGTRKMRLRLPAQRYKNLRLPTCNPKFLSRTEKMSKINILWQKRGILFCSTPRNINYLAPRSLDYWAPRGLGRLPALLLRYHIFLVLELYTCLINRQWAFTLLLRVDGSSRLWKSWLGHVWSDGDQVREQLPSLSLLF